MNAPGLSPAQRDRRLATLARQVSACPRCPALVANRTHAVFGTGNHAAEIMLIGEAPGRTEDLRGEPFVGAAGKKLDRLLAAAGLQREDVFIANIIKCRPPNNRKPLPQEILNCRPYLESQIELIRPRIIAALGAVAAGSLLDNKEPITRLRGAVHQYRGIPVVCTYHPAYALRNPAADPQILEDLRLLVKQWKG